MSQTMDAFGALIALKFLGTLGSLRHLQMELPGRTEASGNLLTTVPIKGVGNLDAMVGGLGEYGA